MTNNNNLAASEMKTPQSEYGSSEILDNTM